MTSSEPATPDRIRRSLLAQIVCILVIGSLVGVVCNELNRANRISYFAFKKQEVLESRLAESIAKVSAPAGPAISTAPLEVAFFFAECPECEIIHKRVLPEIARLFGGSVVVRKYDCADMANYKRLLEYERRFGSKEDDILKLFIGRERYLAGVKQIVAKSVPLIGGELTLNGGRAHGS